MQPIICRRCGTANDPTNRICNKCGLLFISSDDCSSNLAATLSDRPAVISPDEYNVPIDATVTRELNSIPILPKLVSAAIQFWNAPLKRSEYLGNGIKIGPNQGTTIFKLAEECGRLLGINTPDIYVKQDPTYNAFTFGSNEEHFIVLHSALVDNFSKEELQFIIGHEMGHIKSKHVVYQSLAMYLNQGLGTFFGNVAIPVRLAINKWVRESELTADRAGLLCTGELKTVIYSLVRLAVGSEKILSEFNLAEYLEQAKNIDNFYAKMNILLQDHPYIINRVISAGNYATSAKGKTTLERLKLYRNVPQQLPDVEAGQPPKELTINLSSIFCKACGYKNESGIDNCIICGEKLR